MASRIITKVTNLERGLKRWFYGFWCSTHPHHHHRRSEKVLMSDEKNSKKAHAHQSGAAK